MKRLHVAGLTGGQAVSAHRRAEAILAGAVLAVLVLVALLLVGRSLIAIAEPEQIAGEAVDEVKPAMDGDWLAFYRGNDLLVRNLASGTVLQLASGTVNRFPSDGPPAISGNRVVWTDHGLDLQTGQKAKILYTDLPGTTAKRVDPLGPATARQSNPDVAGDIVVWEDNRFNGVPMVYLHNLSSSDTLFGIPSGVTDRVDPSQGTVLQLDPAISILGGDAWTVWRDYRNKLDTGFDLYGKDLTRGINPSLNPSHRLSSEPADVAAPDMAAGRYATWTADVGEPTDLDLCYTDVVLQTTLGQAARCFNSPGRQEAPVFSSDGTRIYWQDWRNGDPATDINADIYVLLTYSGSEFNLTGWSGANQKSPAASGMRYAWEDRSSGNYDVWWDTAAIMLNAGARYTRDCRVSVNIFPPVAGGSAQISNDKAEWKPLAGSDWLIPCAAEGLQTVFARFGDAGSTIYSDEIYLDVSPPSGAIEINGGATTTATASVMVTLLANDGSGSGIAQMRIAASQAGLDGAAWIPYVGTYAWTFDGPGEKVIWGQFRDGAGNLSAAVADSITYSPPVSIAPPVIGGSPGGGTTSGGTGVFVPGATGSATGSAFSPPTTTTTAPKVLADKTKPVITKYYFKPNPISTVPRRVNSVVHVPVRLSGMTILKPVTKVRLVYGTTFYFTLSEPARVILQFNRLVVPTTKKKVKGRWVIVKGRAKWAKMVAFGPYAKKKGTNSLAWNGKVGRTLLPPGTYQAVLQAKDPAGNISAPRTFVIRVLGPPTKVVKKAVKKSPKKAKKNSKKAVRKKSRR